MMEMRNTTTTAKIIPLTDAERGANIYLMIIRIIMIIAKWLRWVGHAMEEEEVVMGGGDSLIAFLFRISQLQQLDVDKLVWIVERFAETSSPFCPHFSPTDFKCISMFTPFRYIIESMTSYCERCGRARGGSRRRKGVQVREGAARICS